MTLNGAAHGEQGENIGSQTGLLRVGARHQARPRRSVADGEDVQFLVDNHGRPYVRAEIHEPLTAFGEVMIAELTPVIQVQFPYGLNPREVTALTDGTGAASVASSLLTISTGATASSDVILATVKSAKYQPGQGMLGRWTTVFSSPVNGTEQEHGLGNQEDGFMFAYKDVASVNTFGVLHRSGGKLEFQTLTVTTGAVTAGGTITINLDGVATEVEVVNGDSVQAVARAIGAVTFTEFESQVIGDTVVFISHHASNHTGTFSLVDTDTTGVVGSFVETIAGATPTDIFVAQADWNLDKMNGSNESGTNPSKQTLVQTNGNVYQVQFQWLGFGDIVFSIENENTGRFHSVHRIAYANNNTTPSIQNPTLPLFAHVDNGVTTSDIVLKSSSMAVFIEGKEQTVGIPNGITGSFEGTATTEQVIVAIKNKPVFQSVANRVSTKPKLLTFSCAGSGAAKFHTLRATINPILGGDPSFTDVAGATSPLAFDVAATTLSGGNVVATWTFGNSASGFQINLDELAVLQPPGVLFVFSIQTNGGTTDSSVAFLGQDLF